MDATVATAGKECQLGSDPAKFLERFEDWYEHHILLTDTMGVENNRKLKLLLLWGGKDFRKFAKDAGVVTDGDAQDSLDAFLAPQMSSCEEKHWPKTLTSNK